jgi:hypothetical protein
MQTVIDELVVYLRGWKGYYGFAQARGECKTGLEYG